jgi:osmotically inducible protein OsmC
MTANEKVIYTGRTHTTGGRTGASRSSDGRLEINLTSPGTAGGGTNPEQLFAAGWSISLVRMAGISLARASMSACRVSPPTLRVIL